MTTKNRNHIEDKLQSSIQAARKSLAGFLNRHFNKLSSNAQKLVLLLFGLAVGSICFLLIIQFLKGGNDPKILQDNEITVLENIHSPNGLNPNLELEYRSILHYKQWLDSLTIHDKSIYDSIVARHRGLPDSIDRLLNKLGHHHNLSRKERIGIDISTH